MDLDIKELAREISARLAPDALLNAEDVAAILRCSPGYVLETFIKIPGFPSAIRLPGPGGRRGHPRWKRSDIIEWVDQQANECQPRKAGARRKIVAA